MDTLLRAINEPETIRVIAATTTEAVREACRRQEAQGMTAMVIGRALTSGVLLATLAKAERERVRIQLGGGGPVGQVIIDAHGDGRVRACVERRLPQNRLLDPRPIGQRPSTTAAVGTRGHVVVTRDLGLATPYQGSVDMRSGEIDEDLEHYLDTSEQLPSALRTEVVLDQNGEVLRAAGILAQSFPGSDHELITAVRERLAGDALRTVIGIGARERDVEALVGFALGGENFRCMLEHAVTFHCPCGLDRALSVLATLGAVDLEALADEQEQTEVRCNFCGQATMVDAPEVRRLAARLRNKQS
jgi:molecular chaperone Hsp33